VIDRPRRDPIPFHPRFNEATLPSPEEAPKESAALLCSSVPHLFDGRCCLVYWVCALPLKLSGPNRRVHAGDLESVFLNLEALPESLELFRLGVNHAREGSHDSPEGVDLCFFGFELLDCGGQMSFRGSELTLLNIKSVGGDCRRHERGHSNGEGDGVNHGSADCIGG
jgi:hypothetical protein